MIFYFIGMMVDSVSKDTIKTDIDGLLRLLNTDGKFRNDFCCVKTPKGSIKVDDLTVRLSPIQISYDGIPMDYAVYVRDEIIGYANIDFLYTGLKFLNSIKQSQTLIDEIEYLESVFPELFFYRSMKMVGLFEWLDQVLKGDPEQIHKHYLIRNRGAMEIHLKTIVGPSGYKSHLWGTNFPEFEAKNQKLLDVLTKIFNQTSVK